MSEKLTSTKDLKRVLGFWDLMAIATGAIIGSGIMSLTGIGIGRTGRSIFVAFIIGGFITLLARSPQIFLNSVARFRGGDYSMVGTLLGPRWTGTYSMISLLTSVTLSMYALSFADYAMPFLPWITRKAIALGILTLLFAINVFGVNVFAKFQTLAVALLIISLTIFTVIGLTRLDPNYFEKSSWMTGGFRGLWRAAILMSYTCDGAQGITSLSAEAKNPTKDIPRVMLLSTVGIAVFYGLLGVVAAGVLPVEQVANQPLTVVAGTILSKPLYYLFVIGFVPIVLDFDIGVISDITITVGSITKFMIVLSLLRLPKVMPEAWKKSDFYISNTALKAIGILDLCVIIFSGFMSSVELPLPLLAANLAVVAFAFVFGRVRFNSGKVNVEVSYELPDSEK
ncbi:APC family permease [[Clostridium] symbiosum]|uniref:APC family permease n=1 Tax=Clostridium symbiosum TaxID=1512 RepID=UPI0034A1121E